MYFLVSLQIYELAGHFVFSPVKLVCVFLVIISPKVAEVTKIAKVASFADVAEFKMPDSV
jgi:uncharacterized membrane protein